MKSILQSEKRCYVCGLYGPVEEHHTIHGNANRKVAEKYGFKVFLCYEHHRGTIRSTWKIRTCIRYKTEAGYRKEIYTTRKYKRRMD